MAYTTAVPDSEKKPDNFEFLNLHLQTAFGSGREVYLLGISRENYDHPEDVAKQYSQKIPGIDSAIRVNSTVDFIVVGDKGKAADVARNLHIETGEPVGIIKYEGQNGTINIYVQLREAINLARQKGECWHFYDPNSDSIEAVIRAALTK